ncbi:MAG: iron transporter [Micrococcales bacterium]|nr:iron transporter [Micrococcales bacterium]
MLANFLIGLREGLEASLIVGILVAYLLKTGNPKGARAVLWGTLVAVAVSILAGLALSEFVAVVPEGTNELIAGLASIIAVFFVTWMIFWMAKQARSMKSELHKRVDSAVNTSTGTLIGVAFFAVIREGIETSVFIWSASRATGTDTNPLLGAALGLIVATGLGYGVYKGALKLNLSKFFKYTGAFLIIVAAGILAYGIHELQEIGLLPLLTANSYDLSGLIPKDSAIETLLRGTISFRSKPSWLETIAWFSYAIPVAFIYLKPAKKN